MTLNLKTFCVGALLCCLTFFTTSFTPSFRDDDSRALSCVVEVRNPDGSVAKYVEVTTSGAGGVYCEGGRTFEADVNGKVSLYWADVCRIAAVYIKGRRYKVDYQDGGSYTLNLK